MISAIYVKAILKQQELVAVYCNFLEQGYTFKTRNAI